MNISNKKTVLFFSISTLMINGCVSNHELKIVSPKRVAMSSSTSMPTKNIVQSKKSWKKFKPLVIKQKDQNKVDCIDCYAAPLNYPKHSSISKRSFSRTVKKPFKISESNYATPIDYSEPPSSLRNPFQESNDLTNVSSTKHYGSYSYMEKSSDRIATSESYEYENENLNSYLLPDVSTMNNSYGTYDTFSNNPSISIQVGAFRQYSGAKRYLRRYSALSNKYRTTIKTGQKDNQPIYRVQIEGFKSDIEAKRFMNSYGIEGAFLVRR